MTLHAGTGVADITPPVGARMAAFPHKQYTDPRRAEGTHDPLKARALVVRSGEITVGLCTVDLCGMRGVTVERIRDAVARRVPSLDGGRVLIAASHTHAGAETSFLFGGSPDDPEVRAIEARVVEAIVTAAQDLEPVELAWGRTTLEANHNRRVLEADGRARMALNYEPGATTGVVDADLHAIRLDRTDGAPKAIAFHYTAHALTLGRENLRFSADYPGRACAAVEATHPGCTALFLNGAAGNVHPRECMRTGTEARDRMGDAVADATERALAGARHAETTDLALASTTLTFPNRLDPALTVALEVDAMRLGPLVLGFVPGEFFVEFQLAFRKGIAPHPGTLVGYANGWTGYASTRAAYTEGGYGVDLAANDPPRWCRTCLPPGAGEQALERVLALAREVMPATGQATPW
ncbi:MAG: neutral/alkaline non-lysosomal ceramidase N-terminal domain-containing protein [Planctomycetota bacterium]